MKHLLTCGALLAGALLVAPASAETVLHGGGGGFHGGGVHASAPMASRSASAGPRFDRGGNFGGGHYRGGNGWGAGAAGFAAGAVVGGAIAANNGYYGGPGYYGNDGYYADGGYGYDAPDYAYGAPAYGYQDPGYVQGAPMVQGRAADESDVTVTGSNDSVSYCEQTFKSYNPSTGTYLGYDGQRHSCP